MSGWGDYDHMTWEQRMVYNVYSASTSQSNLPQPFEFFSILINRDEIELKIRDEIRQDLSLKDEVGQDLSLNDEVGQDLRLRDDIGQLLKHRDEIVLPEESSKSSTTTPLKSACMHKNDKFSTINGFQD
ncbi:unnamed protein product [Cuscuta epithymum]|uniref:Uncharacterized protein n=1 Tax=Cuscuta epithymum TaxID=186058 RepID=A0AAV0CVZ3_9ASTE|nr:unnamed protein product [Cuscuta epithymum]